MISSNHILTWSELANCPEEPGIYAWYFRPELTDHDIAALIQTLRSSQGDGKEAVESFFHERLFRYFTLSPYHVELSGQLKARYWGKVAHIQDIAPGLIDRIIEIPERIFQIRDLLQTTSPMFASPLYVGMSKNIRVRIKQHCSFITQLRERSSNPFSKLFDYDLSNEEKNFAQRVVEREMPSSRLFIAYQATPETYEKINVDVESIINRIYYPAFGRN